MTPDVSHALLAQAVEVHPSIAGGPVTRAYPAEGIRNNNLVFAGHHTVLGASEYHPSLLKFVFHAKLPGSVPERQGERAKAG
jgi:hypothetical protein